MEFGRNGAVLSTDEDVEREHSSRPGNDVDLCIQSVLLLSGYAGFVTYAHLVEPHWSLDPAYLAAIGVGFLCAIFPVASAFAARAVVEHKLPERWNLPPKHDHIGGGAAIAALIVIGLVALVALKAAEGLALGEEFAIPEYWGDIAITFVAVLFAAAIFGPRISNTAPMRFVRSIGGHVDRYGGGLGRAISILDSWLVYIIAPMVGVTQKRTRIRYSLLLGNLAPCCVAAWFLPAPMGLLPVLWALLIIAAVARRWAWIEDDREVAMLTGNFASEKLRVGFDEDLSDETLWSYLSLIALLPIAMHQVNEWGGGHLFGVKQGVPETRLLDFWAWLAFYGTELAKSIPFVDWSEIYSVRAASDIVIGAPGSRHVVFAVRAITDLAFLAVLLQALGIAARTRKQIELFHDPDNPLDRLDPFVEPVELRKLVRHVNGQWEADRALVQEFPKYNALRLHELRRFSDRHGPLHAAATALLRANRDYSEPIEKLAEIAGAKKIKLAELGAAWQRVVYAGAYDLETLEYVRQALNWKSGFEQTRVQIVRAIVDMISPSPERTNVLRRIFGDPQIKDSLGSVRQLVIEPLFQEWRETRDPRIFEVFERGRSDSSKDVKVRASQLFALMTASVPKPPESATDAETETHQLEPV